MLGNGAGEVVDIVDIWRAEHSLVLDEREEVVRFLEGAWERVSRVFLSFPFVFGSYHLLVSEALLSHVEPPT